MRTTALLALTIWLCTAAAVRADIASPEGVARPGAPVYRVHVIDRDAIAGHTIIAVSAVSPTVPAVVYTIVDDFAHDGFARLCAVPSSMLVDSPAGSLGSRMLRGAPAASGAAITGETEIARTLALFAADGVVCSAITTPPDDPALAARHVEAIEDTIRIVDTSGGALHTELVSVSFLVLGQPPLVVAAMPGGGRPSIPPIARGGCGCSAGTSAPPLGVTLALLVLVIARRKAVR